MKSFAMRWVLACMAWVMMAGMVSAQDEHHYHIKVYGITDDLKVRGVVCMAQINGFMWIGTADGLLVFDGQHAPLYEVPGQRGTNGYYGCVTAVQQAADGTIWTGTKKGICKFDINRERLVFFSPKGLPKDANIEVLKCDSESNLWVIANHQVYKVNVKTKTAQRIGEGLMSPNCLTIAADGTLWMGDDEGVLYRYDVNTKRLHAYEVKPHGVETFQHIVDVTEMRDGSLAVTTSSDGVYLFSSETFTSVPLMRTDDEGVSMTAHTAITPDGENLWVGTERGIIICNVKTRQLHAIRQARNQRNSLSDNAVYSLFADMEHGVWVGTYYGGLNRISLMSSNFHVCEPEDEDVDVIGGICEDAYGHVWVGTEDGGLYMFDRQSKRLVKANVAWGGAPQPFNVQSLQVVDDELWALALTGGLYVIDTKTLRLKRRYPRTDNTEMGRDFNGVGMCKQDGTAFLCSKEGLYVYDSEHDSFYILPKTVGLHGHHLCADRQGNVWMATLDKGLWLFRRDGRGEWKAEQTGMRNLCANVVLVDSKGKIWVGTEQDGLWSYDAKSKRATQMTLSERLRHETVTNIVEDQHHRLWISTFNGLYAYNMDKKMVNHFSKENGLPTENLNYSAGFVDDGGNVYIGTYKGLLYFNPGTFVVSREKLTPYFLNLYVDGKHIAPGDSTAILKETLFMTKELALLYHQNTFALSFAVPTYRNESVVWYRYRLNPDAPWVVTDRAGQVQLNNLSAGTYKIELQASYNPDVWEGETARLKVTVSPPVWLSVGAVLGYVMLIALTVILLMSMYSRRAGKN